MAANFSRTLARENKLFGRMLISRRMNRVPLARMQSRILFLINQHKLKSYPHSRMRRADFFKNPKLKFRECALFNSRKTMKPESQQ